LIQARHWDALEELAGLKPDEVERFLKEETFADAADVNRAM
jgi:hypothetical protein